MDFKTSFQQWVAAGDLSPETFATLPWGQFDPASDVPALREWLVQLEQSGGVGPLHHVASRHLREHLRLLHPYFHEDGIGSVALSPDGRYLATGSHVGSDYAAGGSFMLWEMATGCPVQALGIEGGMGWPDYAQTMVWRPDGKLLGCAFDTNVVGALDPFGGKWEMDCNVTDGWSRPPAFCWTGDGQGLYVACWDENASYKETEDGPWNNPGNWVPLLTGRSKGCGVSKTPWGDELQPYKHCQAYGNLIVGHNYHDQLYASHPNEGIVWCREADEAWYGSHHFLTREDGAYVVYKGNDQVELWRCSLASALSCHLLDKEGEWLLILLYPQHAIAYRNGAETWKLDWPAPLPSTGWGRSDVERSSVSPGGNYLATLAGKGALRVWSLQGAPEQVYEGKFEEASGVVVSDTGTVALLADQWVCFVDAPSGRILRTHDNRLPSTPSPLEVKKKDLGKLTASGHASCPVQVDGRPEWAVVLEEGAVMVPKGVDPDGAFNCALGGRWCWPLRWAEIPTFHSMADLVADQGLQLPAAFREAFQPPQAKKDKKSESNPLPLGSGMSLRALAGTMEALLDGLKGSWGSAKDDKRGVLALWLLEEEMINDPLPMLRKCKHPRAAILWTAICGWAHSELDDVDLGPYCELVERYLPELDAKQEPSVLAIAGGLYMRAGREEEGEALLAQGHPSQGKAQNERMQVCHYLIGLLMADEAERCPAIFEAFGSMVESGAEARLLVYCATQYCDRETTIAILDAMSKLEYVLDWSALEVLSQWIAVQGDITLLDKLPEWFPARAVQETELKVALKLHYLGEAEAVKAWFTKKVANPAQDMGGYLEIVREWFVIDEEGAAAALFNPEFSAPAALAGLSHGQEKWMRNYLYLLNMVGEVTPAEYSAKFADTKHLDWTFFGLLGALDALPPDHEDVEGFLDLGAGYASFLQDRSKAMEAWAWLCIKAKRSGNAGRAQEFMKAAMAGASKVEDYELGSVVVQFAEEQCWEEAYEAWMRIKPKRRKYNLKGFLAALMEAEEYGAVDFLLQSWDADDINERPNELMDLILEAGASPMVGLW